MLMTRIFRRVTKVEIEKYKRPVPNGQKITYLNAEKWTTHLDCGHKLVTNKIQKKRQNRKTARCEFCEEEAYEELLRGNK